MFRRQDAERGVQVAKVLEGFISRKVVKQTVMTVVYGVTRYGGRLQIEKRLRELSDFPQVCGFTPNPACSVPCWAAGSSGGGACFPPLWGEGGRDPEEQAIFLGPQALVSTPEKWGCGRQVSGTAL